MIYEKKALKALYELSRATQGTESIDEVFDKILSKAMKIIGVDKASIMYFDQKEEVLKIFV